MKRLVLVIAVIVIAVGAWLAFSGKNTNTNIQNTSASNQNTSQSVSTDKVTINNFAFSPDSITVKKGTSVTWTNQDSVSHTVTENDGKVGPGSPLLSQGKTYSFTFNQTGTFHYHCSIHNQMTGTVVVTD